LSYQLERLIKPIDLSITTTDTSSPTNDQPPSSSSSSTSSVLPPTAAAALNFFHIKNMIELTVESARLREKQLETEIGRQIVFLVVLIGYFGFVFVLVDLRNELTKEQDNRQKVEQENIELRRVKSRTT